MNALIYMIAALFCGAFTVRTWTGGRWDPVRRAFIFVSTLTALSFGGFTLYLLPGLTEFKYLHAATGAFLPVALLWFFSRLFRDAEPDPGPVLRRLWALTPLVILAYLAADTLLFAEVPRASAAEVVLALYVMAGFGFCLHHLWDVHQHSQQKVERARIRYLLALLTAAVSFTALEQLTRSVGPATDTSALNLVARSFVLQGAFPPLGAVVGTLFLYFLYQVVERARLLDLNEIFSRLFTLTVAALLLVVVYGITVLWVGSLSTYPVHGTFLIFLASMLFLSFYDPIRARIEALSGEWFNRQGRQLEISLLEADRGMAKAISMEGLENELLGRLQKSGRAQVASLYLWDQDRRTYRLTLQRGKPTGPLMQRIARKPFTDGFSEAHRAYVRSELERQVRRRTVGHEDAADRLRTMDAMDADVTISIRSGDLVLGWLNAKDEDWSDGFSRDEVRRMIGTVDRAAILLENIYGFKQLEEQHRLAALGTMAAGMAHEIRNPLAGIKGAAQYLHGDVEPDELRDFLAIIVEEANRLDEVVSQFLDFARPYEIKPQMANANTIGRKIIDFVQMEDLPVGLTLEFEEGSAVPELPFDPDKIRQVLLNLVYNAIQATGPEGTVTMRTGQGRLVRPPHRGAPAVEISVRDDGPGVATEDIDKLFIPFFTTKRDGTGLGLAISRRIVEAHGGEIVIRSRPGRGSTFTVRLPVPAPENLLEPETEELALPIKP